MIGLPALFPSAAIPRPQPLAHRLHSKPQTLRRQGPASNIPVAVAAAVATATAAKSTRKAKWSSWNSGHGVELNDDETIAKRRDHYSRPEGHCIVVSETPIASAAGPKGADFYAEIKIENDSDAWASGFDMGITALTPDVVGLANEQGLCWADFPDTWVLRGDGMLRINGRAYPPGAMSNQAAWMRGWDTAMLELGDTCGLHITKDGKELVGLRNGEVVGRLVLDDIVKVPTDGELYLICDVIGRAGEVQVMDVPCPLPKVEIAPAPAVSPPAKKAPAKDPVNHFWEIMQRRPPMYR
ncbi:unnamed protein product [Effrenium voratum]|uniref:NHR domain-containing protein n=1 Tax=Effrenium voratum TaxID=2562239 RepID=A0AA36NBY0_9DINO|nr:unnamed protein product [Effrenium voratum]